MIGAVPARDENGHVSENTFQIGDLVDVVPPPFARPPAPPAPALPASRQLPADPLKPGAILKTVRARIKAIRAELRAHAALEKELAELDRLLKAATQPNLGAVRAIESARRSG